MSIMTQISSIYNGFANNLVPSDAQAQAEDFSREVAASMGLANSVLP